MTISIVQNYRDKIRQIFTMRYNLKFRKLTFYCLTRPQSIRKSKQISGQTILSSPKDVEFNPNSVKKTATFAWLKIALHGPSRQLPINMLFKNNSLKGRLKANSKLNLSVNLLFSLIATVSSDTTYRAPGIASHFHVQFQTGDFPQKIVYKQSKI